MTKEEILNKSYQGLYRQGEAGWDENNGFCSYFSPNGNKCAVGVLFSDDVAKYLRDIGGSIQIVKEDISSDIKYKIVNSIDMKNKLNIVSFIENNIDLLKDMQSVHDSLLTTPNDYRLSNTNEEKSRPKNKKEFREYLTYHYTDLAYKYKIKLNTIKTPE
jgi:hypothetical protein